MTAPTEIDPTDATVPISTTAPRDVTVKTYVERHIGALLARLDAPGTRSTLARLRGAIVREPGSVPEIWAVTVDGVPGHPRGDDPTSQERAVHAAMTLFAVHQQSRSQPMHIHGVGLGQAIRQLERATPTRGDGDVSPVRRRFDALASATTIAESAHHLRGIVGQLRAAGIALDYGALADDLVQLQSPGRTSAVRLRWARQYYRTDALSAAPAGVTETIQNATDQTTTEPEETH